MTYQEIKERIDKCETILSQLKDSDNPSTSTKKIAAIKKKVEVLRESLLKEALSLQPQILSEAENTAFINGKPVEYEKEDELKKYKDNSDIESIETAKGKKIKEKEGVEFSVEETKIIATEVGKALIDAIREVGD